MNFFKPRFWDNKQISIYSIFLLPISLIIQLLVKMKNFLHLVNKFLILLKIWSVMDKGNKKIEKTEICFLSQNLGFKKFIFNY